MKLQRENLYLLLIYAFIGAMAACVTGYLLYQKRQSYWHVQARETFHRALVEEVYGRSSKVPVYSGGYEDLSVVDATDRKKEPTTVFMAGEYGEKIFEIPYEKHIHNLERPSDSRAMHSIILEEHPSSR